MSCSCIRWAFNVNCWKPTLDQWKLTIQCVQKEECERSYRFMFVEDCKSSMVGQLLMRKAASECLGLPYDKIRFCRTSSGKPYLLKENGDNFFFNVSHHGDFCVLAANLNSNVGIDVMKVEHRRNQSVSEFFLSMKKQFSSYEWDFITQPGLEKDQLRSFYRLWCLKESYVKAIGTGIVIDLQSISFSCPTPKLKEKILATDTKLYKNGKVQLEWTFEETLLDDNHCVVVATEPLKMGKKVNLESIETQPKLFDYLTFEDLVKNCKPFAETEENFWEIFQSKSEKKK